MPHTFFRIAGSFAVAGLLSVATANAAPQVGVVVRVGPPVPVVAVAPPPPPAPYGLVWQSGYYAWTGAAYQWVPGVWVRAPYAGAVWAPGRWVHQPRGWFFVRGYWHR
jgi:hypothetical protein